MITDIQMNNFKKFTDIRLKNLGHINIILGTNNIGKSTILEGIFALTAGRNLPPIFHNLIGRRTGGNILGPFDYMERIMSFNQNTFDSNNGEENHNFSFKLMATIDRTESHSFEHIIQPSSAFGDIDPKILSGTSSIEFENGNLRVSQGVQNLGKWNITHTTPENITNSDFPLTFPPTHTEQIIPPFKLGRFVDILTHREQIENTRIYSFLKREKVMQEFLKELRTTFSDIVGIDSIPYMDGSPAPVSLELADGRILPIYNFGDGVQRWFNILGGMILYKDSVHCIEEIDSTFHYGAQKQLSKNLVNYSKKYGNQLFLSSHSIEFIDNFLTTVYGEESDIDVPDDFVKVITLIQDPENKRGVLSRTLNGREAFNTREDYGLELR